jgi:hypothetical protein
VTGDKRREEVKRDQVLEKLKTMVILINFLEDFGLYLKKM